MSGKVLFITGASSGIGAATAKAAAASGWKVGLMARSADKLEALAAEIGENALALPGDVTDLAAQQEAIARLVETFGGLDAAYANAGRGTNSAGVEAGDPEAWHDMIHVNVLAALHTAHAALPHLRARKGHMVFTGSAAGRAHIKGSVYGATKFFIHGLAGNLAEEMREWGGRCTLIAPGMVDTPFFDEAKPDKLHAEDVADAVVHALNADPRNTVREIFLMPTN
ncbi:SDR family oxidoreductase [Roseicyclus sp. F158]|uniref:SDR family oxidoreductase n=1 Tax=Tropicimonas omnivorans TaxID=3075590 RepID=A0ABU3DGJ7_9RHOB|nr:SDR family oxidoreductase [Roseicyclus sp. F158]MDT0682840.1 SDR family oxidoreductase [Roseicyclus sp. F158]